MGTHTPEQRAASAERLRKSRYDQTGHTWKKHQGPPVTKERALQAIEGSSGIQKRIARRLGCSITTWKAKLKLPEWADVLEAYQRECEALVDDAEDTIKDIMRKKKDPRRFDAAKLVLTSRGGWERKIVVQGGDRPISVKHSIVDVDVLGLPIEVRRALLQSAEKTTGDKPMPEYIAVNATLPSTSSTPAPAPCVIVVGPPREKKR